MSEIVRTRFAPSPTGSLHVGGARTALFNWLYAKHCGGKFILRVEDTDEARNTEKARQAIFDGLKWLGLDWDEGPEVGGEYGPYFQSERTSIYEARLEKLRQKSAVYDDGGAVRFRFPQKEVVVSDMICGDVAFDAGSEPDMTIRRPDGSFIFHFVNVVDDIEMGITHVLRGEDHLANTWKHLLLYEAFDAKPPKFAHNPLILDENGAKLSKRHAGGSVQKYQEAGWLPEAVVNYLCLLGWSPKDDTEKMDISEVIDRFDFDGLNRSPAKFDMGKAEWLNAEYLMGQSPAEFVKGGINFVESNELELSGWSTSKAESIFPLFQTKVKNWIDLVEASAFMFSEKIELDDVAVEKLAGREDASQVLSSLKEALDEVGSWSGDNISNAIQSLADQLGVKKGALMFPCRVGTSGRGAGPDLLPMMEILGKDQVIKTFEAVLEKI